MSKKKRGNKMNTSNESSPQIADENETPTTQPDEQIPAADAREEVAAEEEQPTAEEAEVTEAAPDVVADPEPEAPAVTEMTSAHIDPAYRTDYDLLVEQFNRYCGKMARGRPVGEAEGRNQQIALWRMMESVFRKEGDAFTVLFTLLLSLLERERRRPGVLEERMRYRYFGSLTLGEDEARSFESILNTLLMVSNPQDRALKLKMVDMTKVFSRYADKAAVARIVDYFGI